MKLRQRPEDFRVTEITKICPSKEKKAYKVFLLEKVGLETFSLISYLSRNNKIPVKEFGIAGLKDKHAKTCQYFTIPDRYDIKTKEEENFKISLVGYSDRPISLGDLLGNRFEITVRDIKKSECEGISRRAEEVKLCGVPNYFDSQRFGSVTAKEFIVKHLIRKDYASAVKIFLTEFSRFESAKVKSEKREILKRWPDIRGLSLNTRNLSEVIRGLREGGSWLEAYKMISPNLRELYVSAYQSYLWNECVKELLKSSPFKKRLYHIRYNIGSLIYYKGIQRKDIDGLPKAFQTISDTIQPTAQERGIIDKVLSKEGLSISQFSIKRETGNFFKTAERKVIVIPDDFSISSPLPDELNSRGHDKRLKFVVSFSLPKGSYATVVTKKIFNQ